LISFVTLLTYGVLISQLGFYRDDWYQMWTAQSQGSAGLIALFQSDRPLVGYLYALAYRFIGTAPLGWHIYALVVRLIGSLAFFWLARSIWRERRAETTSLALLFAVYPGFASQPNAGVYVSLLIANAAVILSFALTAAAFREKRAAARIVLLAAAFLLGLLYLGIFEAMIGLEAARFALLWYLAWRENGGPKQALGRAFKSGLPFLLLAAAFLYWRLFIFHSTRRATNVNFLFSDFTAMPLRSVLSIALETFKDALETTFFSWVVPFYQFTVYGHYRDMAFAALTALAVCAAVALYLFLARRADDPSAADPQANLHLVWLGVLMTLVILVPFNAAGKNVVFAGQGDRYALPGALGTVFVAGGLLFHYLKGRSRQVVLLGLVAMSVVVHYFSAAWYRDFWTFERKVWWQIIWRAPAIERGAMLFIPYSPFAEGYEIYGPANAIYYPGETEVVIGAEVLNAETAVNLLIGKSRGHYDRSNFVENNYDRALIAVFPSGGSCLHVLDGRKVELPGLIDGTLVSMVAERSKIEVIDPYAVPPAPPAFLGEEPPHDWCYYYQKMNLARQRGEWDEVLRLENEAAALDLAPNDVSEWMPVLEAQATLGSEKAARRLGTIIRSDDTARFHLCRELKKEPAYPLPYNHQLARDLVCSGK